MEVTNLISEIQRSSIRVQLTFGVKFTTLNEPEIVHRLDAKTTVTPELVLTEDTIWLVRCRISALTHRQILGRAAEYVVKWYTGVREMVCPSTAAQGSCNLLTTRTSQLKMLNAVRCTFS